MLTDSVRSGASLKFPIWVELYVPVQIFVDFDANVQTLAVVLGCCRSNLPSNCKVEWLSWHWVSYLWLSISTVAPGVIFQMEIMSISRLISPAALQSLRNTGQRVTVKT